MATVTITNLTGNVVLLQELYRDVKPYETFTVEREEDQLHAMPALQKLWADGVLQISVVKDPAEDTFITTFLHSVGPAALSPNPPITITKSAAIVGVQNVAAHGDHKHDVATAGAVELTDSTSTEGISTSLARADHQHSHGARAGGTLHAVATTSIAGFMDPADKTKLDGIPSGATATPLTSSPPANVTKDAAVIGVATSAARADHKHDATTASAIELSDSTSLEGTSASLSRADHVHAHGNRGGGGLHAEVVPGVAAGFISSADKIKLDGISTNATNTPLSSTPPVAVQRAASVIGSSAEAAHADHRHDAVTATAVEITDSTNGEGAAASLARSDHLHAHGNRGGGTLHALATTVVAGFMDPADKVKLVGLPAVVANATATGFYHEPTITPELGANPPGHQASLGIIGTTIVIDFTVNSDSVYRIFKIPTSYSGNAAFHVHWTKESGGGGNGNHNGQNVRWRISYTVFESSTTANDDINVAPSAILLDDTYTDAGTTTRLAMRTASVAATGFVAGYYLGIMIEAITPAAPALTCSPALISADLTFDQYINQ